MKTSNKILLSFLIFLFSGIILLYAGSKYYSDFYNTKDLEHQEKPLSPFSVIVAEPGAIFSLKNGKENIISHTYKKGTVPNIDYAVRNDTLFITSIKSKEDQVKHTSNTTNIYCTNIKSIVAKENSDINLDKFETDSLAIKMNKSRLNWKFDKLISLSVQAKDSDIYLHGKNLEKANVQLDKTQLRIATKTRINKISGILTNDSDSELSYTNHVHIDTDQTSSYNFFDFNN